MDDLTNDAKYLLSRMYAEYIQRRKNGDSKSVAINFGKSDSVHEKIMPAWLPEDVRFTIKELKDNNFLNATMASDVYYNVSLTPLAISKMESKFKDDARKVLDFAVKVKSLIPFI
ncbi:hypothetical protein [Enterococcus faecium]|uniref:hypothetical protein n=1 Tax=Enterococcus faecium TaxID=1352 RepID=UPI00100F2D1D|nr:hypothetical protein [Enterococcus faecium]RXW49192.1 hypothetical protein CYQ80_05730 [Enterococcus faecium]RXW59824.1 hypothetical protein CYQ75_01370 [Enterococcus faecium]